MLLQPQTSARRRSRGTRRCLRHIRASYHRTATKGPLRRAFLLCGQTKENPLPEGKGSGFDFKLATRAVGLRGCVVSLTSAIAHEGKDRPTYRNCPRPMPFRNYTKVWRRPASAGFLLLGTQEKTRCPERSSGLLIAHRRGGRGERGVSDLNGRKEPPTAENYHSDTIPQLYEGIAAPSEGVTGIRRGRPGAGPN
jgi:hypothetical protein